MYRSARLGKIIGQAMLRADRLETGSLATKGRTRHANCPISDIMSTYGEESLLSPPSVSGLNGPGRNLNLAGLDGVIAIETVTAGRSKVFASDTFMDAVKNTQLAPPPTRRKSNASSSLSARDLPEPVLSVEIRTLGWGRGG